MSDLTDPARPDPSAMTGEPRGPDRATIGLREFVRPGGTIC